jgi:glycosyltransferase involved in cell wall biosynthesis
MRICHLVPSLEARHGGPSQSVRALASHQVTAGAMVELLTTRLPEELISMLPGERTTIRAYPRVFPRFLARSPGVERHLTNAPIYDVIHHHSIWLRTLAYSAATARRSESPLVISPRGMMSDWAWAHRRWRKQLATWFVHPGAFEQAAAWHATSHEEAQDIRRRGFRQPICVAPNGVFVPHTAEVAESRALWRQLCPATNARPVALFYSRLHRKKRVRELIDLWLSRPRGDWLLLVVGTPEDYTAESLSAELAARGAAARVAVFDGTNRPPPYGVASLFLLPSHSENFGLVIAEALAAGVPALVTDSTPWLRLGENEAGWCVAWEEYEATLARALAMDRDELVARGAQGRQWMIADFSWDGVARTLLDFYHQLVHG